MGIEIKIIFKGKVQGVFFRNHIRNHAQKLHLCGFAKNMSDGSVEVRAIGKQKALQQFLIKILQDPGMAQIVEYEKEFFEGSFSYEGFSIL